MKADVLDSKGLGHFSAEVDKKIENASEDSKKYTDEAVKKAIEDSWNKAY